MPPKTKPKFRVNKFIVRNDSVPGYIYIFMQPDCVKIGLSRKPLVRKSYLQQDYGQLQTMAIVWAFNMKFIESQMHKIYASRRIRREPWKSGFTEWFQADYSIALEMRICLHLLSFFFNSAVVLAIVSIIALILLILLH